MIRSALALTLALTLFLAPVEAQDDSFFSHFNFKELRFHFHPAGLEDKTKADGQGSALSVQVSRVEIKDIDAQEFRHCIDSDESFCSYDLPQTGNRDGMVTTEEVDDFRGLVKAGITLYVDKAREFMQTLRNNISVDGMTAQTVGVTDVVIEGAEGDIDSTATILVDITAKVTYDNDPKAGTHTILVNNITLRPGFSYTNAVWKTADSSWKFDSAATKPDAARSTVGADGLVLPQIQFENLGEQGLEMKVDKGATKGRSPGLDLGFAALTLAVVALWVRRS